MTRFRLRLGEDEKGAYGMTFLTMGTCFRAFIHILDLILENATAGFVCSCF